MGLPEHNPFTLYLIQFSELPVMQIKHSHFPSDIPVSIGSKSKKATNLVQIVSSTCAETLCAQVFYTCPVFIPFHPLSEISLPKT